MIGVILWYSTGVWRVINEYFRKEFNDYLKHETEKNKYIKLDRDEIAAEGNIDNLVKSIEQNLNKNIDPDQMSNDNRENRNHINSNGLSNDKIISSTQNEHLITTEDSTNNIIETKNIEEQQHKIDTGTENAIKLNVGITGVNALKFSHNHNDEHKINNHLVSNLHSHDNEVEESNMIKYWNARKDKNNRPDNQFCQHQPTSDEIETKCL